MADDDVKSMDTRVPADHGEEEDVDDVKTAKTSAGAGAGAGAKTTHRRKSDKPKKIKSAKRSVTGHPFADGDAKRVRRFKPGTVAKRQINKEQKSVNHLIPRAAMKRLIAEIVGELPGEVCRLKSEAVDALRTAAEEELITVFNVANALNVDVGKRTTLGDKPFRAAYNIINRPEVYKGGLANKGFYNDNKKEGEKKQNYAGSICAPLKY